MNQDNLNQTSPLSPLRPGSVDFQTVEPLQNLPDSGITADQTDADNFVEDQNYYFDKEDLQFKEEEQINQMMNPSSGQTFPLTNQYINPFVSQGAHNNISQVYEMEDLATTKPEMDLNQDFLKYLQKISPIHLDFVHNCIQEMDVNPDGTIDLNVSEKDSILGRALKFSPMSQLNDQSFYFEQLLNDADLQAIWCTLERLKGTPHKESLQYLEDARKIHTKEIYHGNQPRNTETPKNSKPAKNNTGSHEKNQQKNQIQQQQQQKTKSSKITSQDTQTQQQNLLGKRKQHDQVNKAANKHIMEINQGQITKNTIQTQNNINMNINSSAGSGQIIINFCDCFFKQQMVGQQQQQHEQVDTDILKNSNSQQNLGGSRDEPDQTQNIQLETLIFNFEQLLTANVISNNDITFITLIIKVLNEVKLSLVPQIQDPNLNYFFQKSQDSKMTQFNISLNQINAQVLFNVHHQNHTIFKLKRQKFDELHEADKQVKLIACVMNCLIDSYSNLFNLSDSLKSMLSKEIGTFYDFLGLNQDRTVDAQTLKSCFDLNVIENDDISDEREFQKSWSVVGNFINKLGLTLKKKDNLMN